MVNDSLKKPIQLMAMLLALAFAAIGCSDAAEIGEGAL